EVPPRARGGSGVGRVGGPWPPSEPVTFDADLERLRQLSRNNGYYHTRITYDVALPAEGDQVRVDIWIDEGPPVYVESVTVELGDEPTDPAARRLLLEHLPIARDQVFAQDRYERAYAYLRSWYREHGFARVEVERTAEVAVRRDAAAIRYRVDSGPPSFFGDVDVTGTHDIEPDVVRREIVFKPGEPFKQSLVEQTRSNIVG